MFSVYNTYAKNSFSGLFYLQHSSWPVCSSAFQINWQNYETKHDSQQICIYIVTNILNQT